MKRLSTVINSNLNGLRLDSAIAAADLGLSRGRARAIINLGGVYLNGKRVRIASRKVSSGDKIVVEHEDPGFVNGYDKAADFKDEDILLITNDFLAINKPPNLPSQPTRTQAVNHVLSSLERYFQGRSEKPKRMILIHRLDAGTSGVVLIAANGSSAGWLTELFKTQEVLKKYHAVVRGIPDRDAFCVSCRLSVNNKAGFVDVVESGGQESITEFRVIEKYPRHDMALVEALPRSGRTHQIRVHLAHVGYPVLGDRKYGTCETGHLPCFIKGLITHPFLHARLISFMPKDGRDRVEVEAPYPKDFEVMLKDLRIR
ncbi:MAG: RluA family pseudouridine synthase [Oligoflexales bacterium]|nr:RluA family pseudouridine synthase [Oligoflexales bacterium]